MQFRSIVLVPIVVGLALASILACEQEAPIPTPTPRQVEEFYEAMELEQAQNPERLKHEADQGRLHGLIGKITKIDDSKIQFHINKMELGKDEFVECEFSNSDSVLKLNIGDMVTVYGNLHKAFPTGKLGEIGFKDNKAVKLKECRLPNVH